MSINRYYKCGPHRTGLTPGDEKFFHPDCVVCVRLLGLGLRTGLEGPPPKHGSKIYFGGLNLALYKELKRG